MGCCFSAGDHHPETNSVGGAPPTSPPPVLEEETVKEVLLETPAAVAPEVDDEELMPPEWKVGVEPPPPAAARGDLDSRGKAFDDEIVSEVSDVYSYSESYSNATAGHEEKLDGEDDGVVDQRPPVRKRRGPTGGRGRGRGRSGERVVARRSAPSPERRGHAPPLRPARGRQSAGPQRNAAEGKLGRRSRSPARRDEGVARRNVAEEKLLRRSRSPVRRDEDVTRRNAGGEKSGPAPAPAGTRGSQNDVVQGDEVETIENPVVSLECFIFL